MSDAYWKYRILGVDNGTNNVGVAIVDLDLRTGLSTVMEALTFRAERIAYKRYPIHTLYEERLRARTLTIGDWFEQYLEDTDPHIVGIESPFMLKRRPNAFAALSMSMTALRDAALAYRPLMPIVDVPPLTAKQAVCLGKLSKHQAGDKEAIRKMIQKHPHIEFHPDVILDHLDEHSVDAIAVAQAVANEYGKM